MRNLYIFFALIFLSFSSYSTNVGAFQNLPSQVKVADWFGFAKGALSLTFDDGLLSQTKYVGPLLFESDIKATFFLSSSHLTADTSSVANWRFGYWEYFKKLAESGHEIGNHSCTHPHLSELVLGSVTTVGSIRYEISQPVLDIQKYIPDAHVITFAYPFGDNNEGIKKEVAKTNIAARGVSDEFIGKTPLDWMDIATKSIFYGDSRTLELDIQEINILQSWIEENTIKQQGWSVYLAHDVIPFSEINDAILNGSWQPVSLESFKLFSSWLQQKKAENKLWLAPFGTVAAYIHERNNLNISYDKIDNKIALNITDNLPNDIYNIPISFEVEIPTDWVNIEIIQNGKPIIHKIVEKGKVRFDTVPDLGLITIMTHQ